MMCKQPPAGIGGAWDWCVEALVLVTLKLAEWAGVKTGVWDRNLESQAYLLRLKVKRRRAARAAVRERLRLEKLRRDWESRS